MPASISFLIYIVDENIETIGNYNIQKGIALTHLPHNETQSIQFTYFIPETETTGNSDDGQDVITSTGEALLPGKIYLAHGKFTCTTNTNTIAMIILAHILLPINTLLTVHSQR
jgi:mannitol/fructose-specific phosphotransferase system IIA component (Ntr-type)